MLILVRHGQSPANAAGELAGRADLPLTEIGHLQAKAVAAALESSGCRPVRIVSSPLARAFATAEEIGGKAYISVDERWTELDYGDLDGKRISEVPKELWKQWRASLTFRPPGGESHADVARRVREACEELRQLAAGADVVVVSHVSPIKAAVAWALDTSDRAGWNMHLATASITRIRVSKTSTALVTFGEVGHLQG